MAAAIVFVGHPELERGIDLGRFFDRKVHRQPEGGGHDADDSERRGVELNSLADDSRICAETAAPYRFAEQHHLRAVRDVLFGEKGATQKRLRPYDIEEICRDQPGLDPFGLAPSRERDRRIVECGHPGEDLSLAGVVCDLWTRNP